MQRAATYVFNLTLAVLVAGGSGHPALISAVQSWMTGVAVVLAPLAPVAARRPAVGPGGRVRLGRFHGLKGPGIFWLVVHRPGRPLRGHAHPATEFFSESTLTTDTVPVNVDAICLLDGLGRPESVLEVENYYRAIVLSRAGPAATPSARTRWRRC